MTASRRLVLLLAAALAAVATRARAEDGVGAQMLAGLRSSFAVPLHQLDHGPYQSEWANLFAGFSGNLAFDYPLSSGDAQEGSGTQGSQSLGGPNFQQTVRYNPLGSWFGQITFYQYVHRSQQEEWNPDFSYAFGYDDWRPYTLSLVYSNYTGNRLDPSPGQSVSNFDEGTISFGWKFRFPEPVTRLLLIDPDGVIDSGIYYVATPRYSQADTTARGSWKQALAFPIRFTVWRWLYANITFFTYPDPGQQQPWDPDFTYGFGYYDWHPWTFSVQYNNYSGNRYPGRAPNPGNGGFDGGSFTLLWSWGF